MQSSLPPKLNINEFSRQIRGQLVPLTTRFAYFFTGVPAGEDDVKEYLEDPVRALPPSLLALLPETSIILVPYLERGAAANGSDTEGGDLICFEKPDKKRSLSSSQVLDEHGAFLVFSLGEQDVAEYHYCLFRRLAGLAVDLVAEDVHDQFNAIIRDELTAGVHGEVDEESWELKRSLIRRQRNLRRRTKGFAKYARQALADTLTLYLHGICCDIDVETGPRQLGSRHLRHRLEFFSALYPPPAGYAVFPEDLNHLDEKQST
jgi:hypothetical protein